MEKKKQDYYIYHGFGFPVALIDVQMAKIRGEWTPFINYNTLQIEILKMLAALDARLSGFQVRFIRQHFELTYEKFAKRFSVTHPAVIKWEKAGNKSTGMNWSTEKDIRLYILSNLKSSSKKFHTLYKQLESVNKKQTAKLEISGKKVAA